MHSSQECVGSIVLLKQSLLKHVLYFCIPLNLEILLLQQNKTLILQITYIK
jgi:hypothetical protein